MAQKQKANAKFGRNNRAPSNSAQTLRTARNKARRAKKHGVQPIVGYPKREVKLPVERAVFAHMVTADYRTPVSGGYIMPKWVVKNGVTLDVYPAKGSQAHFVAARNAREALNIKG